MGRAPLVISKDELEAKLHELESSNQFGNRNELYAALAKTEWAKTRVNTTGRVIPLNPAVIYTRVRDFNIQLKTPVGKRGLPKGTKRMTRKEKTEKNSNDPRLIGIKQRIVFSAANHRKSLKEPVTKLVDKALGGSKAAAIKLKCLECCCWVASEARNCKTFECPLFLVSPFTQKGNVELTEEELINEEN